EVVYTLFSTLLKYRSHWRDTRLHQWCERDEQEEIRTVNLYGMETMSDFAMPLSIDFLKLKEQCRREYEAHHDLLKHYLSPYAYRHIRDNFSMDRYDIDIMLWSQIVYRLLYVFDGAPEQVKKDVINVLKPLYFARSIAFDYQTYHYSINSAENEIRQQAMAFLSQKPYLVGLYLGQGTASHATAPFGNYTYHSKLPG
ncbi:MAG: hypothetical protein KJN62_07820, partial [Deltaproteobacteria bacterium]|nr:hypothetical protein [Deltaproteobacteria bacterium]